MTQRLAAGCAVVFMLCAPAMADPTPPPKPVAPRMMNEVPFALTFQIKTGAVTRSHEVSIVGDDCAEVTDKTVDHSDQISACSIALASGVQLRIQWTTRAGATEYHNRSSLVIARGGSYAIGASAPNGARLAVQVK